MAAPKHTATLERLRVKPDDAQLIANQFVEVAQSAGILIDALADYIGVTTVTLFYWRRGDSSPRRGDLHLMSWVMGLISFMVDNDELVNETGNKHERIKINTDRFVAKLEEQNVI